LNSVSLSCFISSSLLPFHTDAGFRVGYVESTGDWTELPMPFTARYSPQTKHNGLIQCHREETTFKCVIPQAIFCRCNMFIFVPIDWNLYKCINDKSSAQHIIFSRC